MIDRPEPARNYLSRIRGVAMLPQERVAEVFSLEEGLIDEPISSGRMCDCHQSPDTVLQGKRE